MEYIFTVPGYPDTLVSENDTQFTWNDFFICHRETVMLRHLPGQS